jgi:hypothetical protein
MSEALIDATPAQIMEMSTEVGEIAKVLPKAQAAMGEVFKNANNPAFKSKYADLAAVIEAVVPALNKHGITLLQPASFDGQCVNVATMLMHESGQWLRCTLASPLAKRDAQGIGSAVTYLRRYGLQAMSGVAPEDDDGNAASQPGQRHDNGQRPEAKRADPKPPTLTERADRFAATLSAVKSQTELQKAYDLGAALCAELDAKDPERLVEINDLYERRLNEFASQKEAA